MPSAKKAVRRALACIFSLILALQCVACVAPPLTSSDEPADKPEDYIIRTVKDETILLGVKDRTRSVYLIPDGVTTIDESAFFGCNNATKITIPDDVTSIGDGVFRYCNNLEAITVEKGNPVYVSRDHTLIHQSSRRIIAGCQSSVIPTDGSVTVIGRNAFAGQTRLKDVTIPDGIVTIEEGAFNGCTGLSSLTLPDSLSYIGASAFLGCIRISTLDLDTDLFSIGKDAFRGCLSLYSVTLGGSLESIESDAFLGCEKLVEVINLSSLSVKTGSTAHGSVGLYAKNVSRTPEDSILDEEDGFLFFEDGDHCFLLAYTGKEDKVTLPTSHKDAPYAIYRYAFYATGVTAVTIPDEVTALSMGCFSDCVALESIRLPATLAVIPQNAFHGCTALCELSLPASVTSVQKNAFLGASSLLEHEDGILYVDDWAVGCQARLDTVTLRTGTRGVADNAFTSLGASLKTLILPDGLEYIGSLAFFACTDLHDLSFPETVLSIGESAFEGCRGIQTLTLGESLLTIGASAFSDCTALTELDVKSLDVVANAGAFARCKIQTARLPARLIPSVASAELRCAVITSGDMIPQMAFFDCKNLEEVSIAKSVTEIGASAFQRIDTIKCVYYEGSRAEWDQIKIGIHNSALTNTNITYHANLMEE